MLALFLLGCYDFCPRNSTCSPFVLMGYDIEPAYLSLHGEWVERTVTVTNTGRFYPVVYIEGVEAQGGDDGEEPSFEVSGDWGGGIMPGLSSELNISYIGDTSMAVEERVIVELVFSPRGGDRVPVEVDSTP